MNTTTNHIPKEWKPNNGMAFYKWMHKIKSNYYSDVNEMDKACLKCEKR